MAHLLKSVRSMTRPYSLFVLSLVLFSSNLYGQGLTNLGTDFWFGFMPNGTRPADYIRVYLASNTVNRVEVSVYGGASGGPAQTYRYDLAPNTTQTVTLDVGRAETRLNETPMYRAVHVSSTNPLACSALSEEYSSSDGFLALPTHALSKEYYTSNFNDDMTDTLAIPLAGEFLIVAPYDNTDVQITSVGDTRPDSLSTKISHHAGIPWDFRLMKGQTFLVQSIATSKNSDISGTHILSNRPIALLSGHQACGIRGDITTGLAKSHLIEMLQPVDEWGKQAFDLPMIGRLRCGDYMRIMSGEDNNAITVNDVSQYYLSAGMWFEINEATYPTSILGIKRTLAMQYSYSPNFDQDPAIDFPFMCTLPSQEQFQKEMLLTVPKSSEGDFTHYITFIGEADSLMGIVLDGHTLSSHGASTPNLLSGTSPQLATTRIQLAASQVVHLAKGNIPFGAYLYGTSSHNSYGWPAAIGVAKQSGDVLAPLITPTQTNCLKPAGTIKDTGSGIALIDLILDSADLRGGKASYNVSLSTSSFETGDSVATYSLIVLDPTKAANADLVTFDRAGNMSRYEYTYSGSSKTFPAIGSNTLPALTLGGDSCWAYPIQNKNASRETIDSIYLAGASQGMLKLSSQLTMPVSILTNDTIATQVCFQPTDTGIVRDTILMQYECGVATYALSAKAVTGLLVSSDVDFGTVAIDSTSCKSLTLRNVGDGLLTIERNDLPANNSEFSIDTSIGFPLVIQSRSAITLDVCFHPTKLESGKTVVHFTTGNFPKYLHSIRDSSIWTATSSSLGVSEANSQLSGNSEIVIEALTPNPSKGDISMVYSIKKSAPVTIAIYDERGALVQLIQGNMVLALGTFHLTLDLSALPSGSYLVRISSASSVADRKFMIER